MRKAPRLERELDRGEKASLRTRAVPERLVRGIELRVRRDSAPLPSVRAHYCLRFYHLALVPRAHSRIGGATGARHGVLRTCPSFIPLRGPGQGGSSPCCPGRGTGALPARKGETKWRRRHARSSTAIEQRSKKIVRRALDRPLPCPPAIPSSPRAMLLPSALTLALPPACSSRAVSEAPERTLQHRAAATTIAHVRDFASAMPPHLALMTSVSWFTIPSNDPQSQPDGTTPPGPAYGNAGWPGSCGNQDNDPAGCSTCVVEGVGNGCKTNASPQRSLASRRRPLAGIYSWTGQDAESRARLDLMLSTLRRPCDDGAKIDAWAVIMSSTTPQASLPVNITIQAMQALLARARSDQITNAIVPGLDSTWYANTGQFDHQSAIDSLTGDFAAMAKMVSGDPTALTVAGKPVLYTYLSPFPAAPNQFSADEWATILQNARNQAGLDFYVVASTQVPGQTGSDFFRVFDAISPWIQLWNQPPSTTVPARQQAASWAKSNHAGLYAAASTVPDAVVFGMATPGFDDYTENWGQCMERQVPVPSVGIDVRDPALLPGE